MTIKHCGVRPLWTGKLADAYVMGIWYTSLIQNKWFVGSSPTIGTLKSNRGRSLTYRLREATAESNLEDLRTIEHLVQQIKPARVIKVIGRWSGCKTPTRRKLDIVWAISRLRVTRWEADILSLKRCEEEIPIQEGWGYEAVSQPYNNKVVSMLEEILCGNQLRFELLWRGQRINST